MIVLLLLGACSTRNPIIKEDLEKMSIQCLNSDQLIEITNDKSLDKVLKEINNSHREGTEEMELSEGHMASVETASGETYTFVIYSIGKTVIDGYYIHSNIPDFCGAKQ